MKTTQLMQITWKLCYGVKIPPSKTIRMIVRIWEPGLKLPNDNLKGLRQMWWIVERGKRMEIWNWSGSDITDPISDLEIGMVRDSRVCWIKWIKCRNHMSIKKACLQIQITSNYRLICLRNAKRPRQHFLLTRKRAHQNEGVSGTRVSASLVGVALGT